MATTRPARKATVVESLARICVDRQKILDAAGKDLHDHVGPLLAGAGIQLQLLSMDVPGSAERIRQTTMVLEQAMDQVRALSQKLNSSPAYRGGLKNALQRLADRYASANVLIQYSAKAIIPLEIAAALFEASERAVAEAIRQEARKVRISVTGVNGVHIRIADDGLSKRREKALLATRLLAGACGLVLEISTGKSTIVSIRYADGSPTRR